MSRTKPVRFGVRFLAVWLVCGFASVAHAQRDIPDSDIPSVRELHLEPGAISPDALLELDIGGALVLPWFDGQNLSFTIVDVDEIAARGIVNLYGADEDEEGEPISEIFLTIRSGSSRLIGSVLIGGETYRILPFGEDRYLIIQTDPDRLPERNDAVIVDDRPGEGSIKVRNATSQSPTLALRNPRATLSQVEDTLVQIQRDRGITAGRAQRRILSLLPDDGSTIDLLIGYTAEARIHVDVVTNNDHGVDITLLLEHAVSETNRYFQFSGVQTRLRIVGMVEVGLQGDDVENTLDVEAFAGGFIPALFDLSNRGILRDQFNADLVTAVVRIPPSAVPDDEQKWCGRGIQPRLVPQPFDDPAEPGANASQGFNMVEIACVLTSTSKTVAHEVAHNLGAGHDEYQCEIERDDAIAMGAESFELPCPTGSATLSGGSWTRSKACGTGRSWPTAPSATRYLRKAVRASAATPIRQFLIWALRRASLGRRTPPERTTSV